MLRRCVIVLALMMPPAAAAAQEPPALARARELYNASDYDGALAAAAAAGLQPGGLHGSALISGRASLERFRSSANPDDLVGARNALVTLSLDELGPRDQVDLLVGLGQWLYFSDAYGAAVELFDTALSRGALLPPRDRLLLLDWWASALDRDAQTRPADRRARVFERIASRMEEELRQDPRNAPANYWLAAAARGAGDIERAWNAAMAGWVRSNLSPEVSRTLRADLDRLVIQAIIPERARLRPGPQQQETQAALLAEWEKVKLDWK